MHDLHSMPPPLPLQFSWDDPPFYETLLESEHPLQTDEDVDESYTTYFDFDSICNKPPPIPRPKLETTTFTSTPWRPTRAKWEITTIPAHPTARILLTQQLRPPPQRKLHPARIMKMKSGRLRPTMDQVLSFPKNFTLYNFFTNRRTILENKAKV